MANTTNITDIVTIIKNVSGATRKFGYLPPHGKSLTANQTFTVNGDIELYWPRATQKRWRTAMQNDITNGNIEVRRQHRHIFYGTVTDSGDVGSIAVGDLVYWDASEGSIRPATDLADQGTASETLQEFANLFLGYSLSAHTSEADTVHNFKVDISPYSLYEMTCASATHTLGQYMTLPSHVDNAITSNTNLLVTATATEAIARVARQDTSASTTVLVQFLSAFWGHNSAAAV